MNFITENQTKILGSNTMNKPVDTIEFWNKRIENAKAIGKTDYSVYATDNWEPIDRAHRDILDSHIGTDSSILEAGCGYGRSLELIHPCERYVGIDQVPEFIRLAKKTTSNSLPHVYFEWGVLPGCLELRPDRTFDWVVCISLMVMIISNLGWGKWDAMQKELLRVSRNGVLCLEYTDPEVYYLIRGD